MLTGAARGLALFFGAFTFVNLIGQSRAAAANEKVLLAFLALALLLFAFRPRRNQPADKAMSAVVAVFAIPLYPLAQIALFGTIDNRRPADLMVVFGARAYADGTTSAALKDRVREAARVYHAGLAPRVLFSGGPGLGSVSEPEAMRRLAVTLGVPERAILLDPQGVNTDATIRNTAALVRGRPTRILAVSDFFHLPRIKMGFRHHGLDVSTVPARTSVPEQMPYNLFRETAAFWVYYVRYL